MFHPRSQGVKVKLNLLDRKPWRSVAIPEESGIPRSTFTIGLCCDSKARLDDFCTWKNGKKYGETVDCGKLEVIHGLCQSFKNFKYWKYQTKSFSSNIFFGFDKIWNILSSSGYRADCSGQYTQIQCCSIRRP